jgi:hypothetical protein
LGAIQEFGDMEGNIFQKRAPDKSDGLFVGVRVVTHVEVVRAVGEGQLTDEADGLASERAKLLNFSDGSRCDSGDIQHKGRRGNESEGMSGGTITY